MAVYGLFSESKIDQEIGAYTAYGIIVTDGRSTTLIEDISTEKDRLEALIEKFNREVLDAVHLGEAIENFLYDFEV